MKPEVPWGFSWRRPPLPSTMERTRKDVAAEAVVACLPDQGSVGDGFTGVVAHALLVEDDEDAGDGDGGDAEEDDGAGLAPRTYTNTS